LAGHAKKARSLNKIGVWEELEQLYKELENKEKDYQVAMAIGKMLLEKNKDLTEQQDVLKGQYEEAVSIINIISNLYSFNNVTLKSLSYCRWLKNTLKRNRSFRMRSRICVCK
jgi:hypothetical protein